MGGFRVPKALWKAVLPAVWCLVLLVPVTSPAGIAQSSDVPEPGQVLGAAVHPLGREGPRTTVGPVPLVEVFTATWCPPCAPADRALDRLLDEQSPALLDPNATRLDLAVLEYHPVPDPGGEDPYGVPEGVSRLQRKYDAFWFPSVYVQGVMQDAPETRTESVDAGMEQVSYISYSNLIERARTMMDPFVMTTTADTADGNVTFEVEVRAEQAVAGPLYLQAALWQDDLFFPGSNGVDEHRMTVLALAERRIEPDGLAAGDTWATSWTLPLPRGLNVSTAGLTAFVETAWDQPEDDHSGGLMRLALGSAAAAGIALGLLRRRPVRTQGAKA